MADNVVIPGTGATAASDEVGSIHYQEVKLVDGRKGGTSPLNVDGDGNAQVEVSKLAAALLDLLQQIALPIWVDPTTGAMRMQAVSGTLTTLSTLTSMSQIAAVPAGSVVLDQMQTCWSQQVRPRVT